MFLTPNFPDSVSFARARDSLVYTYPTPHDYTFAKFSLNFILNEKFNENVFISQGKDKSVLGVRSVILAAVDRNKTNSQPLQQT